MSNRNLIQVGQVNKPDFSGYILEVVSPFTGASSSTQPSGVEGQVQFKSGVYFQGSDLYYVSGKFGFGTTTPSEDFHLSGKNFLVNATGNFDQLQVNGINVVTETELNASGSFLDAAVNSLSGFLTSNYYQTGYIDSTYYPRTNPSGYVASGETGVFATTGQIAGIITSGQTGNFVTTGQTGTFVTDGETGNFVTTGQTGIFVVDDGTYVRSGQTGTFVTDGEIADFVNHTQTGNTLVGKNETGQFVLTGQTGTYVTSGETGNFVTSGQTGNFVTTEQTGNLLTTQQGDDRYVGKTGQQIIQGNLHVSGWFTGQHSYFLNRPTVNGSGVALSAELGNYYQTLTFDTGTQALGITSGNSVDLNLFLTTGEADGRYALNSKTGIFVSNGETGSWVANHETGALSGSFVSHSQTGDFITTSQTGNFVDSGWVDQYYYPRSNPSGYGAGGGGGGVVVTNAGNNRIIKSDGTSSGLAALSDLRFDGAGLTVDGYITGQKISGTVLEATQHIDFGPIPDTLYPSHKEGRIFYDDENKTISVYQDVSGVTLQLGQEEFLRVRNNRGATISNGEAVYINGVHGNAAPTVELAIATGEETSHVVGIATHDISGSSFGYVTTYGFVRDLDLSAFSVGDELYLSPVVSGGLTGVMPSVPNYQTALGHVINNGASNGQMLVKTRNPKFGGNDIKSYNGANVSGIPFVDSLSNEGTAIALATSSTFVYDSGNGRFGIGTTSPSTKLHVLGGITGQAITGTSLVVDGGSGYGPFFTSYISDKNGQMTHFRENTSGVFENRAGWGSSQPMWRLNKGGITADTYINSAGNTVVFDSNKSDMMFEFQKKLQGQGIYISRSGASTWVAAIETNGNNAQGDMIFTTMDSSTRAERMRLMSDGDLGLGTVSPSGKLGVVGGDSYMSHKLMVQDDISGGAFIQHGTSANDLYALRVSRSGPSNASVDIYDQNSAGVVIGATASEQSLTVDAGGNIGIGTTTPSQKLHVNAGRIAVSDGYNIGNVAANAGMFFNSDSDLFLQAGGATHFALESDGNVGIGTSSPDEHFHNTGNLYTEGDIYLKRSDGSKTRFVRHNDGSNIWSINRPDGNQALQLTNGTSYSRNNFSPFTSGSETLGGGNYWWGGIYSDSGTFLNRPSVNGTGVMLQGEGGGGGGGTPGGSNTQVQYNNGGSFAGTDKLTIDDYGTVQTGASKYEVSGQNGHNGDFAVDFQGNAWVKMGLDGDITFTGFQNMEIGRAVKVLVSGTSADRSITVDPAVHFLGTKPTTVYSNKVAVLSFECYGSTVHDIVGVGSSED
jgi:hypothetical protein